MVGLATKWLPQLTLSHIVKILVLWLLPKQCFQKSPVANQKPYWQKPRLAQQVPGEGFAEGHGAHSRGRWQSLVSQAILAYQETS